MNVLYLHGLGSSGQSSTVKALARQGFDVIAPDYRPQFYKESMMRLITLVETASPSAVVGTSLGGYYALKLYERCSLPTIAINPCFDPSLLLEKYLEQPAKDYVTGLPIRFDEKMLRDFRLIAEGKGLHPENLKVMIGRKNEVIEPVLQMAFCKYQGWSWIELDWGHRVEDVELLEKNILSLVKM